MNNLQALLTTLIKNLLLTILLFAYASVAIANNKAGHDAIPEPLQGWIDWSQYDSDDEAFNRDCPYHYNATQQQCTWPSKLNLVLTNQGGQFTQQWHIYSNDAQVQLPGDKQNWPQNISSNNQALIVHDINGVPYVTLNKGQHNLKGEFKWGALPKSLGMTPKLGLLSLTINGKNINNPKFNQNNTLWLSQQQQTTANENDLLDIQVFRKIKDNHPIQIETTIKLRVSGKQRNINLSPVMLTDFIPLQIQSRLPARMEGENLTLQLRPGEWHINVISRAIDNVEKFTLPASNAPWPEEEIWVFEANSTMRQVEISGVNSIDPSQTRLPDNWKQLPAYIIKPEQSLVLNTIRRGKNPKSNDKLTLNRQMWLDSNGKGYTIKDQLKGYTELSRLNVIDKLQLGSVKIYQQPQLITRLADEEKIGVEIRHQNIQLIAESRYEDSRSNIPVSGWYSNINTISTQLHLPAGWRLFFVNGVDNLPKSWLRQWSLLDLFLVLVITFACGKLFSRTWGAIALATLVLTWHEANAPNFIWLALLVTVALVKFIPTGKFKRFSQFGFIFFQFVLILTIFPYTVDTIRYSFFPQLENPSVYNTKRHNNYVEEAVVTEPFDAVQIQQERSRAKVLDRSSSSFNLYSNRYQKNLQSLDPNNKIQTGPGLPTWYGREVIKLSWSGPIKAEQRSHLILIPPLLTAVLRLLGIALLLLLASRFIMSNFQDKSPIPPSFSKLHKLYELRSIALVSMLSGLLLFGHSETIEAKQTNKNTSAPALEKHQATVIPRQDILDQLRIRLEESEQNKAPECLPYCAHIESMKLTIQNNVLTTRLRVHATSNTMIPLPGSSKTWLPQNVLLNGNSTTQLQRDDQGHLWIRLAKGIHTIILRGILSQANSLPLPLPLKPHYVATEIDSNNWTVDGIDKNGKSKQQLQLTRILKNNANEADWQASFLPPFVIIDRVLELGLDWQVITTVTRISDADIPINIDIALLPDEKPLSDQITVKDGKVNVKLDARQKTARWVSSLAISPQITLQASTETAYLETWRLNANAIWHWQASGIPINEQQVIEQQALPVWQPWPNEQLQLTLSRPQGIDGQTVTIQNSTLEVATGKRAKDYTLSFTALSSRGTQHSIVLPEGIEIQKITIDKVEQSIQQTKETLTLTLKPGKQTITISWREDSKLNLLYKIPAIDLQLNSVNANTTIKLPRDRWLLWTFGPTTGPAVLFWGIITALMILAFILGSTKITSLKTWHWALLALGLSQTHPLLILILIAWLFTIHYRSTIDTASLSDRKFNACQIGFAGLTVLALLILTGSVANGLLGSPSMSVAGNGSNAYFLRWYQDRSMATLPQAGIISLPLWIYRMLMLAWALWLAMAVLRWLQSAWSAFSTGGLWRTIKKPAKDEKKEDPWEQ